MRLYWFGYRWFMRLAHKFDWHYAPVIGPFDDGRYQRWCKWCGFRESFRNFIAIKQDGLSVNRCDEYLGPFRCENKIGHKGACVFDSKTREIKS
jgi:hypothetical protein